MGGTLITSRNKLKATSVLRYKQHMDSVVDEEAEVCCTVQELEVEVALSRRKRLHLTVDLLLPVAVEEEVMRSRALGINRGRSSEIVAMVTIASRCILHGKQNGS